MEKLDNLISSGNKKLPSTTAIFNLGSAKDCPSLKLGLCQAYNKNNKCICYAKRAERYPKVTAYHRRQMDYWKAITAEEFAKEFLALNAMKRNPFTVLRLNEACDFWGQECIEKAEKIAQILSEHGITVNTYTARSDLDFSACRSIVIMGSNFHKVGLKGMFKMVKKFEERPKGFGKCAMNCRICRRCLDGKNTFVMEH